MRFITFSVFLIVLLTLFAGCEPPPSVTPCFLHASEFRFLCYPPTGAAFYRQLEEMDEATAYNVDDSAILLRWIENNKK